MYLSRGIFKTSSTAVDFWVGSVYLKGKFSWLLIFNCNNTKTSNKLSCFLRFTPNPIKSQADVLWLNTQMEHVRIYVFLCDKHNFFALLVLRLTKIVFSSLCIRKKDEITSGVVCR